MNGGEAEFKIVHGIRITNYGGDIYDLRHLDIDSSGLDNGYLPKNGFVPSNSNLELGFENLFSHSTKSKMTIRFFYKDGNGTKYQQDLILIEKGRIDNIEFQLSKMKILN